MNSNKHLNQFDYRSAIFINVALFAFVLYLITIHRFAFNQPVGDDYDAILAFLNHYIIAQSKEQLLLLAQQHNEHRILLTHFAMIADLNIFGHINFVHLIWFGNLGWLMTILSFWHFSQKYTVSVSDFAPVAIGLLSFSHFEMMTWAMTSIQQYWQVCFGILAIGFMVNNRFKSSLLFYIAAVFTSGGGIILVPLINAYYLLEKKWSQFWIVFIATLGILYLYFSLLPYRAPPASRIWDALAQPQLIIGYFLGFIGGLGNNLDIGVITILTCGTVLCILFLFRCKYMYQDAPFLWWIIIYIALTAFLAALNRSFLGIASSGDSRYSEYSLLFGACIYLVYLLSAKSNAKRRAIVLVGFLISIGLYSYWYEQSKRPLLDRLHWLENGLQTHPNWPEALKIKERSIELGIIQK